MELRVLQYFLTVAREENITRAAKLLHMTQPTLSRQLRQLEEELGVTLFERGNHQVRLTGDGLLLLRRAQEIVDLVQRTQEEFCSEGEQLAGTIVIGAGETHNMEIVAGWMKSFQEKYPLVDFRVQSSTADFIKENIEKGLVDIGLLTGTVDISRYEVLNLPEKGIWGITAPADDELADKGEISPEDLAGRSLIMPWRNEVQMDLRKWLGSVYDTVQVTATHNLIANALCLVRQRMGLLLSTYIIPVGEGLRFIPLKDMTPTSSELVWKKQQAVGKATRRFLEWCQRQKNEL